MVDRDPHLTIIRNLWIDSTFKTIVYYKKRNVQNICRKRLHVPNQRNFNDIPKRVYDFINLFILFIIHTTVISIFRIISRLLNRPLHQKISDAELCFLRYKLAVSEKYPHRRRLEVTCRVTWMRARSSCESACFAFAHKFVIMLNHRMKTDACQ